MCAQKSGIVAHVQREIENSCFREQSTLKLVSVSICSTRILYFELLHVSFFNKTQLAFTMAESTTTMTTFPRMMVAISGKLHVHVHTCIHVHVHTCIHVRVHVYTCTCTCTCIYMYMYMYM